MRQKDNDSTREDDDRLFQEALAELGWNSDPRTVADKVRQLDRGLPAEDEFIAICAWLGRTQLIHKLDQLQAPPASRASYQVPDLLAHFEAAGPMLIEVKAKRSRTLSFTPEYLRRLTAYADLLGIPLLIAWKFHSIWTLFDARHLRKAQKNFNIRFDEAIRQNLLGVLAGDLSYKIAPGAGIIFDCLKEELLETASEGTTTTEQWRMRIDQIRFTSQGGRARDDLHPDVKTLFTTWDLEERQDFTPTHIHIAFQAGEEGMMFGHMALVQLLAWPQRPGEQINWRHAIRRDEVVSSLTNFAAALNQALAQEVVTLILHQQPVEMPAFLQTGSPPDA